MGRYFFLVLLSLGLLAASASAELFKGDEDATIWSRKEFSLDDDEFTEQEDGEGRIFLTGTGTTLVTTNSTLLRALGALIGAGLIGIPLYLAYATALGGGNGGYGYGYEYYKRSKRSLPEVEDDMALQMHMLFEIFRRYGLEEETCQLMLSCEAGSQWKNSLLFNDSEDKNSTNSRLQTVFSPALSENINFILSTIALTRMDDFGDKETKDRSTYWNYVTKLLVANDLGRNQPGFCRAVYGQFCGIDELTSLNTVL